MLKKLYNMLVQDILWKKCGQISAEVEGEYSKKKKMYAYEECRWKSCCYAWYSEQFNLTQMLRMYKERLGN